MLFSDIEVDVPRRKHFNDTTREAQAGGGRGHGPPPGPLDDSSAFGGAGGH